MDVEANKRESSPSTHTFHRYAAALVLIALMAVGSIVHIYWSSHLGPNCDQVTFLKHVQSNNADESSVTSSDENANTTPVPLTREEQAIYNSRPMISLRQEDPNACVERHRHHLEHPFIKDNACFTRSQVQRILIDLVLNASALFQQYGVTHWMDSGTLLGAVRHKGIIPFDQDADMGIDEAGYLILRDTKIEVSEPYALHVYNSSVNDEGTRDPPLPIRLIHRNSAMYVDVFVFYDAMNNSTGHHVLGPPASICFSGCVRCPEVPGNGRLFQVPRQWIFPLRQCVFEDFYAPCPREADKYLDHLYGDDYMTPK